MATLAAAPVSGGPSASILLERIYVGIDVGYREHVAGACPLREFNVQKRQDAWKRVKTLHFSSDAAGFGRLQRYLDRHSTNPADFLILLEPTGGYYGLTLQMYLLGRGYPVLQVENRAVKEYREKVFGSETKTDDTDARLMARMGFLHELVGEEFSIQPVQVTSPDEPALRVMVRDLLKLQKELTRRRNQLQQVSAVVFPEFKTFFKDSTASPAARALMECFPTPQALAEAEPDQIADVLRKASDYAHAKRVEELQGLARDTVGVRMLTNHQWRQAWILKQLPALEEARKELVEQLRQVIANHPYTSVIESLPVRSPIWTATLIAVIGHRERFQNYAEFKAYLGWSPRTDRSGTSVNSSGLAKKGVRLSRNVLGQMVVVMLAPTTRTTPFREYYERLVARGMKPQTAQGNVAGKLAQVLAGMLKTMTPYDERRHRREMGLPEPPKIGEERIGPIEAPEEVVELLTDEASTSEPAPEGNADQQ